mmetsp:Transcript_21898/g.58374  ORF Transcript_21898/g.58374 Transcript_21898/m.58374 type:complete len:114 (-) Transcript_21898:73-414(-)
MSEGRIRGNYTTAGLQLVTLDSSFTFHMSLNNVSAGCHCSPISHALIPRLQLMTLGSRFTPRISLSSAGAAATGRLTPARAVDDDDRFKLRFPLLTRLARDDPGVVELTGVSP